MRRLGMLLLLLVLATPAAAADSPPPLSGMTAATDVDGDKVPDRTDACPGSRSGEASVQDGCSAPQLLGAPRRAQAFAAAGLRDASRAAKGISGLGGAGRGGVNGVAKAAATLGGGDVCSAAKVTDRAADLARTGTRAYLTAAKDVVGKTRDALRGRHGTRGSAKQWKAYENAEAAKRVRGDVTAAAARTVRLADRLATLCGGLGKPASTTGVIKVVDGDRMTLQDGRTVIVAGAAVAGGALAPGRTVTIAGKPYKSAATQVATTISVAAAPSVPECRGRLLVAPPQDPPAGIPWQYFDARGFYEDGKLAVEPFGALGADLEGVCTGINAVLVTITSGGVVQGTAIGRANPATLQFDYLSEYSPSRAFKVRVSYTGLACSAQGCADRGELAGAEDVQGEVKHYGGVSPEPRTNTGLPFTVRTLETPLESGAIFYGRGWSFGAGASSFPTPAQIQSGVQYASHTLPGVLEPNGLQFAYRTGLHDGFAYHRSAEIRPAVDDTMGICSNKYVPDGSGYSPDLIVRYALPFEGSNDVLEVPKQLGGGVYGGQFLFEMGDQEKVLAPRRGQVEIGYDGKKYLRHGDGESTSFGGIATWSAKKGQIVERGAVIGRVGKVNRDSWNAPLKYPSLSMTVGREDRKLRPSWAAAAAPGPGGVPGPTRCRSLSAGFSSAAR